MAKINTKFQCKYNDYDHFEIISKQHNRFEKCSLCVGDTCTCNFLPCMHFNILYDILKTEQTNKKTEFIFFVQQETNLLAAEHTFKTC